MTLLKIKAICYNLTEKQYKFNYFCEEFFEIHDLMINLFLMRRMSNSVPLKTALLQD